MTDYPPTVQLATLGIAVTAAWHQAQGDPERATAIFAALRSDCRRLAEQVEAELREARRAATYYRQQAQREVSAAQRRIERELANIVRAQIGDELDPFGFYVYCLWGFDPDRPLYVGKSTNLFARLGSHMNDWKMRAGVVRITVVRCGNEIQMSRTEWSLIQHYQPPRNTMGIRNDDPHA